MPNWVTLLQELQTAGSNYDIIRRRYLADLHEQTGRNVIAYYSGWLQKPTAPSIEVNDNDKNGFMTAIHELDRSKGLDLILHTPGGETAATESLVDYLRAMFGTNIRAIVPQLAMSAGTMIACAARQIVMGAQSSLGPIDPQVGGVPAHGVIEEFKRAITDVNATPVNAAIWQPIIAKYAPTLVGECEKAIQWSNTMVNDWLVTGMFKGQRNAHEKANRIIEELASHALTLSHARHISLQRAKELKLRVVALEKDHAFQDAVLTVHHTYMHTLSATAAVKIIENHRGAAYIQTLQVMPAVPLIAGPA